MTKRSRLWAIGYDRIERAAQVRDEVVKLGEQHSLVVLDTAIVVRYLDGIVTLNGKRHLDHISAAQPTFAPCLTAAAVGVLPLTEAGVGALVGNKYAAADKSGIDEAFISEVNELLKPGTSALFVLDQEGDMNS